MDFRLRILKKIFLGFPGPTQTRYTPSFLIFKKKLKFDGGYSPCMSIILAFAV
jgi:hypothetical protein